MCPMNADGALHRCPLVFWLPHLICCCFRCTGTCLTPPLCPWAHLLQLFEIWTDTQAPSKMQSDNGKEFTAGIVNELCAAFGVKVIHGSIGYPQSQGAVERCNRTIKEKISAQLLLSPTITWSIQVLPPIPANQQAAGANQPMPASTLHSCWSPDCMHACCPCAAGCCLPCWLLPHRALLFVVPGCAGAARAGHDQQRAQRALRRPGPQDDPTRRRCLGSPTSVCCRPPPSSLPN